MQPKKNTEQLQIERYLGVEELEGKWIDILMLHHFERGLNETEFQV